ncbi:hypothetical protein EII18_08475 [Comamonadaceae bacterium OH3737_COT-264]|nr:hypothetical protein EII18_08475 [Comamonadaceae bacterium OH3737_COT-264]
MKPETPKFLTSEQEAHHYFCQVLEVLTGVRAATGLKLVEMLHQHITENSIIVQGVRVQPDLQTHVLERAPN